MIRNTNTQPNHTNHTSPRRTRLIRSALWLIIATLIATPVVQAAKDECCKACETLTGCRKALDPEGGNTKDCTGGYTCDNPADGDCDKVGQGENGCITPPIGSEALSHCVVQALGCPPSRMRLYHEIVVPGDELDPYDQPGSEGNSVTIKDGPGGSYNYGGSHWPGDPADGNFLAGLYGSGHLNWTYDKVANPAMWRCYASDQTPPWADWAGLTGADGSWWWFEWGPSYSGADGPDGPWWSESGLYRVSRDSQDVTVEWDYECQDPDSMDDWNIVRIYDGTPPASGGYTFKYGLYGSGTDEEALIEDMELDSGGKYGWIKFDRQQTTGQLNSKKTYRWKGDQQSGAWELQDATYYQYHTDGAGTGLIKCVVDKDGAERLLADNDLTDITSAAAKVLYPNYAKKCYDYKYDPVVSRVVVARVSSGACCGGGGGSISYSYAYSALVDDDFETDTTDRNAWAFKRTDDERPRNSSGTVIGSGKVTTLWFNYDDQVILKKAEYQSSAGATLGMAAYWSYEYNADGRLLEERTPELIDSANVAETQTQNPVATRYWWNASWTKRRMLRFENPHAEGLSGVPVLVKLDNQRIDYSQVQNLGQDLRFVDADGTTQLNHEIEKWDETGTSYVWVKVPHVDASSGQDYIYMYYGNATALDGQNATGVWDSNYHGVWHLHNNDFEDSTSNNNDATNAGSSNALQSRIAGGRSLDGADDEISAPYSNASEVTVSAWVQLTDSGKKSVLVTNATDDWADGWTLWLENDDSLRFTIMGTTVVSNANLNLMMWYHVVATYDGTNIRLYIDGQEDKAATYSGTPSFGASPALLFGGPHDDTPSTWLYGALDEVRVSTVARSAAWVATQYAAVNDSFVTFEPEKESTITLGSGGLTVPLHANTGLIRMKEYYGTPSVADGLTALYTVDVSGGDNEKEVFKRETSAANLLAGKPNVSGETVTRANLSGYVKLPALTGVPREYSFRATPAADVTIVFGNVVASDSSTWIGSIRPDGSGGILGGYADGQYVRLRVEDTSPDTLQVEWQSRYWDDLDADDEIDPGEWVESGWTTLATGTGAGLYSSQWNSGYLKSESIKEGDNGTPIVLAEYDYLGSEVDEDRPSQVTRYAATDGTLPEVTLYEYPDGFYNDHTPLNQPKTVVTKVKIDTGKYLETAAHYDDQGRMTWSKDANGSVTYREYGTGSTSTNLKGRLKRVVRDINTQSPPFGVSPPTGFATTAGLNQVTTYEYDVTDGYTRKVTGPDGLTRQMFILKEYAPPDANNHAALLSTTRYSYQTTDTSNAPLGAVQVTYEDGGGNVTSSRSGVLSGLWSGSGVPDGTETFTWVNRTDYTYTTGGEKASDRLFIANLDSVTIGGGTSGTDYLETTYAYDDAGRMQSVTDPAGKSVFYTYGVTIDSGKAYEAQRVYPHDKDAGPVQVSWTDIEGQQKRQWSGSSTATWSTSSAPDGSDTLTATARTDYAYDWRGRTSSVKQYHTLDPTPEYYETAYLAYDNQDRLLRVKDGMGDISATVYDRAGRTISQWQGTDDTDATIGDPGAGSSNLEQISATSYDDQTGTPTGRVTSTRRLKPNLVALADFATDSLVTDYSYSVEVPQGEPPISVTWVMPSSGAGPWTKQVSDQAGRQLTTEVFTNGGTPRLSKSANEYDSTTGRLTATLQYSVTGGVPGNALKTEYIYDDAGRQVKTQSIGQAFTKTLFDSAGRVARVVTGYDADGEDTENPDTDSQPDGIADWLEDDVILTETVYQYDKTGNVLLTATYDRHPNADGTVKGLLSENLSSCRASYIGTWYDDANRVRSVVNYGTTKPTWAATYIK